jgi:hypothetical protein
MVKAFVGVSIFFILSLGILFLWSLRVRVRRKTLVKGILGEWNRLSVNEKRRLIWGQTFIDGIHAEKNTFAKTFGLFAELGLQEGEKISHLDELFQTYIEELIAKDSWASTEELQENLSKIVIWLASAERMPRSQRPLVGATTAQDNKESASNDGEVES